MPNWKKIVIVTLNIVIGVYLVFAMTSFNKPEQRSSVCTAVQVSIEHSDPEGFLSENDVCEMLGDAHLMPVGRPMDHISVRKITETLAASDLIEQAQCYKTQAGHVCISIRQRVPVLRVMADSGADYYVDNHGTTIKSPGYACNVIVATGAISPAYARDSLVGVANEILASQFWKNQVVQLNVLGDGTVEMVPRVGDHIVCLGQPVGIGRKLSRLLTFYREGLSQAGWNRYSRISVEFDNQIVCKRKKK